MLRVACGCCGKADDAGSWCHGAAVRLIVVCSREREQLRGLHMFQLVLCLGMEQHCIGVACFVKLLMCRVVTAAAPMY